MKRFFLVLLCLALANTAWSQVPLTVEVPPGPPLLLAQPLGKAPAALVAPAAQPTIHTVSGACLPGCQPACVPACPPKCSPACPPVCEVKTKTICVPEPSTRIKVTINYGSTCDKICFPKCSLLPFLGGCCDKGCGDQASCGHVYHSRCLVKKVCTQVEPITKCVPVEVPVCHDHGHGTVQYGSPGLLQRLQPGAPVVETIPVAPAPLKK